MIGVRGWGDLIWNPEHSILPLDFGSPWQPNTRSRPQGATADAEAKDEPAKASAPSKGASAGAKFESLFAADAEQASVQRDFAQLSESKRKSLLRREAPELLPLLQDHREKLASLRELLPLLAPEALAKMPASGAEYLKAGRRKPSRRPPLVARPPLPRLDSRRVCAALAAEVTLLARLGVQYF